LVLLYVFPALCLALSCLLPLDEKTFFPALEKPWWPLPGCDCLMQSSDVPEAQIETPAAGPLEALGHDESAEPEQAFNPFDDCSAMEQPTPTDGLHVVTLSDLQIPPPALKEMRRAQRFLERSRIYHALYYLKRAIKLAPQCAQIYNSLGVVYFKGGFAGEAEKAFMRAVELGPASPSAQMNLGLLYLATDRPDEAVDPLERASKLLPYDAVSATNLAAALFRSGRLVEAEQWSLSALDLDPGIQRTVHLLCCIYARQARYREAIDLLRDFFDGRPGAHTGHLERLMNELEELVD
jgi:Flp pilus assembly protein TadD